MGARPFSIVQFRIALHLIFIASLATILLAWNQVGAPKSVFLEIDGYAFAKETRQVQVGGILKEAGITLGAADAVEPAVTAALGQEETIRVTRAVALELIHEGMSSTRLTAAVTVRDALREAAIIVSPYDTVVLDGRQTSPGAFLRPLRARTVGQKGDPSSLLLQPADQGASQKTTALEIRHALPVYVHDNKFVLEVQSLKPTVRETLASAGIELKSSDKSVPSLETPVQAGQHVYVRRAKELPLWVDGGERPLYTFADTVKEALEEAGVRLNPGDRVEPPGDTPVKAGTPVTVIRVNEERVTLAEVLPYSTEYVADDSLEVDQQRVMQGGSSGLRKHQVRILYENSREVRRVIEKTWIETAPQKRTVQFGTKVVVRTLDTPSGPQQYWRKMRVYATWYTPASAGKPAGSPGYGITSLGLAAKRGVIAVDPRVIPYYTELYVPGYGVGVAADTGGGVRGSLIDLAYGDEEEHDWISRWTEVYFLGPGPSPSQIRPPSQ